MENHCESSLTHVPLKTFCHKCTDEVNQRHSCVVWSDVLQSVDSQLELPFLVHRLIAFCILIIHRCLWLMVFPSLCCYMFDSELFSFCSVGILVGLFHDENGKWGSNLFWCIMVCYSIGRGIGDSEASRSYWQCYELPSVVIESILKDCCKKLLVQN